MLDDRYREMIKTYDLDTLHAVRKQLDEVEYPQRANWLDEQIEARLNGVEPLPTPTPKRWNLSRGEGFASFLFRFPALVIDLLVVYIPAGLLFTTLVGANLLWLVAALPFLYPLYVIVCSYHFNQTLGKFALGLMITNATGNQPSLAQCVERYIPDLLIASAMSLSLVVLLLTGFSLPEHGTAGAKVSSFHFQFPLWDRLDDLWDLWIWSELLFLSIDDRRRCLHEFVSSTLVVHASEVERMDFEPEHDPSYFDWLARAVSWVRHPLSG